MFKVKTRSEEDRAAALMWSMGGTWLRLVTMRTSIYIIRTGVLRRVRQKKKTVSFRKEGPLLQ